MTEPKPVLKFPYDPPSCWSCSNAKTCSDVRDEIFMAGPALTTMDDIRGLFSSLAGLCLDYGSDIDMLIKEFAPNFYKCLDILRLKDEL